MLSLNKMKGCQSMFHPALVSDAVAVLLKVVLPKRSHRDCPQFVALKATIILSTPHLNPACNVYACTMYFYDERVTSTDGI